MTRINRIFYAGNLDKSQDVVLNKTQSHYVAHVLRLKPHQAVIVFNPQGLNYQGRLIQIKKSGVSICLEQAVDSLPLPILNIHLFQCLARGEKMDFIIQKAVELGVSAITPIHSAYTTVKLDAKRLSTRLAHWQAIIIHSCEQCGRNDIPKLHRLKSLNEALQQPIAGDNIVLQPYHRNNTYSFNATQNQSINLYVGPEGGFSNSEIENLQQQNFYFHRLGPRVLRTETAALAMISILQHKMGDFC